MDQSTTLQGSDLRQAVRNLSRFVAESVEASRACEAPFHHLVFDRVFPDDVYAAMLAAIPSASSYRPVSGRAKITETDDGIPTRVKIDLFPEYIRVLPPEKRAVWDAVGRALCSYEVKDALVRRLAPDLARRFGADFANIAMYPQPTLTRDIAGFWVAPHPDTQWKGITVQFYLPRDNSFAHVGTIFNERLPDGSFAKHTRMGFLPNSGYAFAVGDDTWHSVDPVGPEVTTRDSILLTYFVDAGMLRFLRNRFRRTGNFVVNQIRHRT